jgi:hypothetical protein
MPQLQPGKGQEPHYTNRAEEDCGTRRAMPLHHEERHQNAQRHWQHIGRQRRQDQLQPFDRRQNRNRRGDRRVPGKQRGPRQSQQQDHNRPFPRRQPDQSAKRQDAPLAPVVGAQQEEDVFHRDDEDQRPDQERQDPNTSGGPGTAVPIAFSASRKA